MSGRRQGKDIVTVGTRISSVAVWIEEQIKIKSLEERLDELEERVTKLEEARKNTDSSSP